MFEKIPLSGISREEWLKMRKTGIGGSDAGALCGVNPYSSAMTVFSEKISDTWEDEDSEAVRIGNDLEDYVARRFMEATGLKVRKSNYIYRSIEHPFMIADVDRLVVGEDAGLECKTASAYSADKWKDGDIPMHYILQCYHYMAVTGKHSWYIAAVILGREFTYRRLEWDDALISDMIGIEEKFWNENILNGKIPSPDGSEACDEVIKKYYRRAMKEGAVQLIGFDEKLGRREEIMKQIKDLEQEQKKIEQEVKVFMKENERAVSQKYSVSWSNVDSVRLDTKKLKSDKPELYREYARPSSTRRFEVRAA